MNYDLDWSGMLKKDHEFIKFEQYFSSSGFLCHEIIRFKISTVGHIWQAMHA